MIPGIVAAQGRPFVAPPNYTSYLDFEGEDGATSVSDTSGRVWTAGAGFSLSTAEHRAGLSSGRFNGASTSVLSTPDSGDLELSGNFVISVSVKPATTAGTGVIFSKKDSDNGTGWVQLYKDTGSAAVVFTVSSNGSTNEISHTTGAILSTSAWVDLVIRRVGNLFTLESNGAAIFSQSMTGVPSVNSAPLRLGQAGPSGLYPFNGWLDNFSILQS